MESQCWEPDFDDLESEWATLVSPPARPVDLTAWTARLIGVDPAPQYLVDQQLWAVGPHDLLHVVGLNRWERAHAAALAWLCKPYAGHGLGGSLLDALLSRTGIPVSLGGPVRVVLDESRLVRLANDESAAPRNTNADIVVRGSGWALVIELRIDAADSGDHASRLVEGWRDEPNVRFLWLSRTGATPLQVLEQHDNIWSTLTWSDLSEEVEVLATVAGPSAPARHAMLDYLRTLRSTFG